MRPPGSSTNGRESVAHPVLARHPAPVVAARGALETRAHGEQMVDRDRANTRIGVLHEIQQRRDLLIDAGENARATAAPASAAITDLDTDLMFTARSSPGPRKASATCSTPWRATSSACSLGNAAARASVCSSNAGSRPVPRAGGRRDVPQGRRARRPVAAPQHAVPRPRAGAARSGPATGKVAEKRPENWP